MGNFEQKVCLITGAATIGLAIAEKFIQQGAHVVVGSLSLGSEKDLKAIYEDQFDFIKTDITKDLELAKLLDFTINKHGRVNVLVSNAAAYADDGAATTRETWLNTLNVNVVSAAIFGEMLRPYLKESGGNIINIGSISGVFPHIQRWSYPVSKAALLHLTKTQALEYAADKIRVNMIRLGHIWSLPFEGLTKNDRNHANKVTSPFNLMERVADPAEVANVVAFVASDEASYMTGSETVVDGGYSALGPEQHEPLFPKLAK
ncbi:SDR family oxidoreductase [Sphingobacterium sp. HJSM2_6]|uniref:SDR family oxidoreductase n=1 Tax=Sphingobacterium sp. HJSM2_6 TaxID=3366264 RepID=UPI003BD38460